MNNKKLDNDSSMVTNSLSKYSEYLGQDKLSKLKKSAMKNIRHIGMLKVNIINGSVLLANNFSLRIFGFNQKDIEKSRTPIIKGLNLYDRIISPFQKEMFINLVKKTNRIENHKLNIKNNNHQIIKVLINVEIEHKECVFHATITKINKPHKLVKLYKKYERLLNEQNNFKNQLIANVNHELKTPLNAMLGFCQLLQFENMQNENVNVYLQHIFGSGKKLLEVIDNLMSLAKLQNDSKDIFISNIVLQDILNIVNNKVYDELVKKKLEYTVIISQDVPSHIYTDVYKLTNILINLLLNSIKFCDEGKITVEIKLFNENNLLFIISDSGIGIPLELHNIIFESFVQVDGSFTRNYEGIGIGLTLSKHFIELLGGEIWLESSPGNGSMFYFTTDITER